MSWMYQQSTGIMRDRRGLMAGTGYSGFGACKNSPSAQTLANQGPIPRGFWDIVGPPEDTPEHGPYVLRLQPFTETKTFNRDGFLICGDSAAEPEISSEGSIVMPCRVRKQIWESGDRILQVIA